MFGISRQAIYQKESRILKREIELQYIKNLVIRTRMELPRLGTRKLYYLLKKEMEQFGIKIGRDALFSFLKRERLLIKPTKTYIKTTNSKHWLRKHPNLYSNVILKRAEEFFVSDITAIKSRERTHYLSLVTDAFSRKIMGYRLSNNMEASNVVMAMKMAINRRMTSLSLIHHSDRGLQYASKIYQDVLSRNNIKPSMTDGYDCYQNALAERINGILKQEFLINKCNNKVELEQLIRESINLYNNKRPHLSLGMKTPNFIHEESCQDNLAGLHI